MLFLIICQFTFFEFYKNTFISPANISFLYHFYTLFLSDHHDLTFVFKNSTHLLCQEHNEGGKDGKRETNRDYYNKLGKE